jgi:Spy/CpxP family protein refolding chaperone
MRIMILSMVMAAALAVSPAFAQDQADSSGNMPGMMMGHGMGMGTGGMGMGGCGMADCEEGMGMMGGPAMGAMAGLGPISRLDLNQDQRAKISKIQLELRKQQWALMGKTFDSRAQLYELYAAPRPDARKIGAVYASIFDVRRQMIENNIEAMNRAREVLTKEQQDKLKQLDMRDTYCDHHESRHRPGR